jgi:excisionase family DNA binding protein
MASNEPPAPFPELAYAGMAVAEKSSFNDSFVREIHAINDSHGMVASWDLLFLAFLRAAGRFGFMRLGPIVIDISQVEAAVERSGDLQSNDYAEFSRLLMAELRRSARPRLDELHFLTTFMNCGKGIPARVFGELGVSVDAVEQWLRTPAVGGAADLLTPEEVADYLKVHVETIRLWIRSGRLTAYRLGGVRALRVRRSDVDAMLHRVDSTDATGMDDG